MALSLKAIKQKPRFKKTMSLIPYIFTFSNAMFGLLAIINALENKPLLAMCCIMLAAIMDGIDGRVARALNSCSFLGTELDSLCDAVSFCAAPAIIVYSSYDLSKLGISILIFYLCAGLFRLARFNCKQQNQQNYFTGLPSPAAAFVVSVGTFIHPKQWILQCLVALVGLLMVSKIKFPTFKR